MFFVIHKAWLAVHSAVHGSGELDVTCAPAP